MYKNRASRQQKDRRACLGTSKRLIAAALVLSFLLAGVALALAAGLWSARPRQNKQSEKPATPNAIENLEPGLPAKEYIYAGGRLIATEEPPRPGGDFDGDGRADIIFYRNGLWGILQSSHNYDSCCAEYHTWGGNGPMLADFDGDGKADLAYIVPPSGGQSQAYAILKSTANYDFNQALFVPAGWPDLVDTPIAADFDGDRKADPAIWRAMQGVWIIPKSSANYADYIFVQWGQSGDVPIAADFDGDGKADIGFYRNGLWGVLKSSQAYSTSNAQFFSWGDFGLAPIVADFDGDGKADLAYIVPPSGGQSAAYAILKSSTGWNVTQPLFVPAGFPSLGDTPVVTDYDGDGKADPGFGDHRPGCGSSRNQRRITLRIFPLNGDKQVISRCLTGPISIETEVWSLGGCSSELGDMVVTGDKEGIVVRSRPLDFGGTPIHRP